jgi:hypothetical protein
MKYWHFKVYQCEDGQSQFRDWYDRQEPAVKAQFDGHLDSLSWNEHAPQTEFTLIPGYDRLFEAVIWIDLEYGVIPVILIGIWQKDSPNFIILQSSEMVGDAHDPPIYKAFENMHALENHKGEIYDHIPG